MQSFTKQEENLDLVFLKNMAIAKIEAHLGDLIYPLKLPIKAKDAAYKSANDIQSYSIDKQYKIWIKRLKRGESIPKRPAMNNTPDHILISAAQRFFRAEFDQWCEYTDLNADALAEKAEKWYYMAEYLKELEMKYLHKRNQMKANGEQMELV